MILIFSKSKNELTTELVIDWIQARGHSWKRINGVDLENKSIEIRLDNNSDSIEIDGNLLSSEIIKIIWFRRWHDSLPLKELKAFGDESSYKVKAHFALERKMLRQMLFGYFNESRWLSFPNDGFNKLVALRMAKEVGIKIPATHIINKKEKMEILLNKGSKLITKSISDSPIYFHEKNVYMMYTRPFDLNKIYTEESFFPTLFQSCINKDYELRIFYLDKTCYAMAIFSQLDLGTKDDFRAYNNERPNRFVPYKLPIEIEDKIIKLMNKLNLQTGSIDMIKEIEGDYIFLEVNPEGQFGMVSSPCNYYLERKLADYLINHDS